MYVANIWAMEEVKMVRITHYLLTQTQIIIIIIIIIIELGY